MKQRKLRAFALPLTTCAALALGQSIATADETKTPPAASVSPEESTKPAEGLKPEEEGFWARDNMTGDWGGLRKQLEDKGLTVGATWIVQGFRNFEGGIRVGNTAASTFDLNFAFDLQKLFNLEGGKFYVDFESHAGPDPSSRLVGDVQKFTKLNSDPFAQVAEIWYEQKLFGDKLRLKIGKVDANTEFSVIDYGLPFLSASTQVSGTFLPFPTFPDPLPGVNVFYTPNETFYASFGAYYANRHDRFLDFYGDPYNAQPTANGMLYIGETGLKWKKLISAELEGNLRLGFWGHTGRFPRLDEAGSEDGTHGFYGILDQTLWKPEPEVAKASKDGKDSGGDKESKEEDLRGLRMFVVGGITPGNVAVMDRHIGGGLSWTGLLPGRPKDILGVTYQYVHLSENAGVPKSSERALETFYRIQFTPWAALQPDLQYIVNPGGEFRNALVGTLNLELHF